LIAEDFLVTLNGTFYNVSENGFSLKGADEKGYCLSNTTEEFYYEDPILTFEDSIFYGCKV